MSAALQAEFGNLVRVDRVKKTNGMEVPGGNGIPHSYRVFYEARLVPTAPVTLQISAGRERGTENHALIKSVVPGFVPDAYGFDALVNIGVRMWRTDSSRAAPISGTVTFVKTDNGWIKQVVAAYLADSAFATATQGAANAPTMDIRARAYIASMKSDLRNLVTAEESFFADSTKYVGYDTAKLRFRPSVGVSNPTIVPGSGYWSATVTHMQLPNFSCGIGVNTTNPIVGSAGDGEPACK